MKGLHTSVGEPHRRVAVDQVDVSIAPGGPNAAVERPRFDGVALNADSDPPARSSGIQRGAELMSEIASSDANLVRSRLSGQDGLGGIGTDRGPVG